MKPGQSRWSKVRGTHKSQKILRLHRPLGRLRLAYLDLVGSCR